MSYKLSIRNPVKLKRNIYIIILSVIPVFFSFVLPEKSIKIIEHSDNRYISINSFTEDLNIHNTFDLVTGKGKLLHKGAIAIYQVDFSVMLINGKLVKTDYPVTKLNGEILFPLKFSTEIIYIFFPEYLCVENKNNIRLSSKQESKNIQTQKTDREPKENKKEVTTISSISESDRISFIIIDPGHGGKDPGAIGKGGLKEKWITLKIAANLEDYLKTKLKKIKIQLTRKSDKLIELAKRTEIANKLLKKNENGIFISIHVNASILHSVSGFETYFLSQNPSNEEARATAALENNVIILEENTKKSVYNDVEHVEAIMITTQIQKESSILANSIQKHLDKVITESASKGVKKADFFVLRGSLMPAVLVEVGYISNKKEASRLKQLSYQKKIVQGIGDGIINFIKEYNKNNK